MHVRLRQSPETSVANHRRRNGDEVALFIHFMVPGIEELFRGNLTSES
jgi:hypothetical protein